MKEERRSDLIDEEMDNIIALGKVLLKIHDRLVKEGKCKVVDGKVVWLDKDMAILAVSRKKDRKKLQR